MEKIIIKEFDPSLPHPFSFSEAEKEEMKAQGKSEAQIEEAESRVKKFQARKAVDDEMKEAA